MSRYAAHRLIQQAENAIGHDIHDHQQRQTNVQRRLRGESAETVGEVAEAGSPEQRAQDDVLGAADQRIQQAIQRVAQPQQILGHEGVVERIEPARDGREHARQDGQRHPMLAHFIAHRRSPRGIAADRLRDAPELRRQQVPAHAQTHQHDGQDEVIELVAEQWVEAERRLQAAFDLQAVVAAGDLRRH